jgi:hypothetical protein
MLQDGIVAQYLKEHCPDPRFRLCQHQAELPRDADTFFWSESVFNRLGRFDGLGEEMRTIVIESVKAYPLWQVEAALTASARQLVKVASGEGVHNSIWHTQGMIEHFAPSSLPGMRASRQHKGEIDFALLNMLHVPVAIGSMLLLAGLIGFGLMQRRGIGDAPGGVSGHGFMTLAVTIGVAILGNAVVCGAFANPHDRYGARIVWLATLAIVIATWLIADREQTATDRADGLDPNAPMQSQ